MIDHDDMRDIQREIDLTGLPYRAIDRHGVCFIEQYDHTHMATRGWTVNTLEEWHVLRDELFPLGDMHEAYALYRQMTTSGHDPVAEDEMVRLQKLFALRGVAIEENK